MLFLETRKLQKVYDHSFFKLITSRCDPTTQMAEVHPSFFNELLVLAGVRLLRESKVRERVLAARLTDGLRSRASCDEARRRFVSSLVAPFAPRADTPAHTRTHIALRPLPPLLGRLPLNLRHSNRHFHDFRFLIHLPKRLRLRHHSMRLRKHVAAAYDRFYAE